MKDHYEVRISGHPVQCGPPWPRFPSEGGEEPDLADVLREGGYEIAFDTQPYGAPTPAPKTYNLTADSVTEAPSDE